MDSIKEVKEILDSERLPDGNYHYKIEDKIRQLIERARRNGRMQIIANLKKHYDETYSEPPVNVGNCAICISLPETTLCKYFKEIRIRREK